MLITIGRRYGSGGKEIGEKLAQRLDVPCYVADDVGVEEVQTILDWADKGPCVIVGFCADHVLTGRPGLIKVFIHSDMVHRTRRLAKELGVTQEEAEREALSRDRERARVYGVLTKEKWADLAHYDLTVDSGPLGVAGTVELLSQFVALKVMRKRAVGKGEAGCGIRWA